MYKVMLYNCISAHAHIISNRIVARTLRARLSDARVPSIQICIEGNVYSRPRSRVRGKFPLREKKLVYYKGMPCALGSLLQTNFTCLVNSQGEG